MPASGQSNVKLKSAVVRWAKGEGKTIHFANRMDLFHLKNAERARHLQKYKGCAVLWGTLSGTNVDAEPYSLSKVFSASQMAAATFQDTISKFLGITGEASGAVSVFTPVKMVCAPRVLEYQRKNVQKLGQDSSTTKSKGIEKQ